MEKLPLPYPVLISTGSHAVDMLILCSFVPRSGQEGGGKLTTVVVLWSHYQSPRERCVETELDIRAVQEGRARGANVRSENSIVESSTGVVAVDVEVVVC